MRAAIIYLCICILTTYVLALPAIPKPTPLLSGIILDVEPYGLDDWAENSISISNQFVDLLEQVKTAIDASPHDLTLGACVPFWFDTIYLQRNSVNKTLLEFVIDTVDSISVMAYRDWAIGERTPGGRTDSVLELSKEELLWGKPNSVEIIVETLCLEDSILSFCEENTTYMESQLSIIEAQASQSPSYYGKSIHYYPPWNNLNPQYTIDASDCSKKRSMFLWDSDVIDDVTKRSQMISFAQTHGISSLKLSTFGTIRNGNHTKLAETLRDIYDGIGGPVQALFGAPDWATTAQTFALNVIQQTLDFIDEFADYAIPAPVSICKAPVETVQIPASITIDFAPYLDPEWADNFAVAGNNFLDTVQTVQQMIKSQNPDIVFTVACPFWYDTLTLTRNGTERPYHEWLIDSVDRILITTSRSWANGTKDGRTDSISFLIQEEMQYAQTANKKVALLLNVYPDTPLLTFNNVSTDFFEQQIANLNQIYAENPAYDGVIINSLNLWSQMTPDYTVERNADTVKSVFGGGNSDPSEFVSTHGVAKVVYGVDNLLTVPEKWKTLQQVHTFAQDNEYAVEWFWEQSDWAKPANSAEMIKHIQLAIDWVNYLSYPTAPFDWKNPNPSSSSTGNTSSQTDNTSGASNTDNSNTNAGSSTTDQDTSSNQPSDDDNENSGAGSIQIGSLVMLFLMLALLNC